MKVNIVDDVPAAVADTDAVGTGTSATGNVITDAAAGDAGDSDTGADTVGADGAAVSAIQSNNPGGSGPTNVGASVTINGQYGSLVMEADGDYTYTRFSNSVSAGTDTFTYTLKDGDGDLSTSTLTITLAETGALIVGSNKNDNETAPNADTSFDHFVPNGPAGTNGDINGTAGNDILVGDPGAQGTVTAGDTANVVLVLDTSGSMDADITFNGSTISRLEALQLAATAAIDSLAGSAADNVRIHLVQFNVAGGPGITFDLITNGSVNTAQVAAAKAVVMGFDDTFDGSGTNYESALQQVANWVAGANNVTFSSGSFTTETFDSNGGTANGTAVLVDAYDTKIAVVSAWIGATQQNVSISSGAYSVGGSGIDANEILRFDFGAENNFGVGTFDPSPGGTPTAFGTQFDTFTGPAVEFATFTFANFSGDRVDYIVHYTDASVDTAVARTTNGNVQLGTDGKTIAYVEFIGITGSGPTVAMSNIILDYDAPLPASTVNKVLFISDGEPNGGNSFTTLVSTIETNFGPIEAVGINVNEDALDQLDLVEGVASGSPGNHASTNITTAQQLTAVVGALSGGQVISDVAGNDDISGGAGNDIIFGDVMKTDALATAQGLGTAPNSGWQVFAQLEALPTWDRNDTINYIRLNHLALSAEQPRTGGNDVIDGGAGNDIIYGQEGNDIITGGADADTISGGSGNDTFNLANGDFVATESIDGGSGTDTIVLTNATTINFTIGTVSGVEALNGSTGNDAVTLSAALGASLTAIDLAGGTDSLTLANGTHTLTVSNTETITGGTGADAITLGTAQALGTIDLGGGTDSLTLANGTNTLTVSNTETITGGTGADTITLGAAQASGTIDLSGGTDSLTLANGTNTLTVSNTETITGGAGNDTITLGTTQTSGTINLVSGTDTLNLAAGANTLSISNVDTVQGSGSNDTLTLTAAFAAGTIDLAGGTGDVLNLGNFTNTLTVSNTETITGGTGADTITLGTAQSSGTINLGIGTDSLTLANGTNTLTVSNTETITGGTGNDTITLGTTQTSGTIDLVSGTDTLNLAAGANTLSISNVDTVQGSGSNDTLTLTAAFTGGTIDLAGGAGDVLNLGNFTNTLTVSYTETITGGTGADTITLGAAQASGTINLNGGTDSLTLADGTNTLTVSNTETITGGTGNDTITLGTTQTSGTINLVSGTDTLNLAAGANTLSISNVDTVQGSGSNDTLTLTAAFTGGTIDLAGGAGDVLNLGNFTNTVRVINTETVNGGTGADNITVGGTSATINAGAGGDRVVIEAGTTATTWNVNLGAADGGAIDTVVFKHAGINEGHNTVATVSDFAVANDRIAVSLGGIAITDGGFQRVTATQTNITAGVKVIELFNSAWDGTLTNDGDGSTIEGFIAAATNGIAAGNYTFVVYSSELATANAGIYSVNITDATNPSTGSMTVEHIMTLNGVGYGNLSAANFVAPGADPIVLDLDHNGVSFSQLGDGVSFDINGDGAQDQIAWTANGGDGILALDVDGSGKIESGKELFTPTFNGGHFADGIAALASLDGNHDGVIDSKDQAFGDLVVWQDANHNGVSDSGELTKLTDLGIKSIDLATTAGAPIDGQHVAGVGSFTYADGTTGTFVEVDLDASLGNPPAQHQPQAGEANHPAQAAEVHDLPITAAAAAEIVADFDHGGGDIDLSALSNAAGAAAPPQQPQGGETHAPVADAGSTVPAAITIMHEQAALAMQLAAS